MIKVLMAAAEAVPFVKTGGLADVIGSLPKALREQGVDVRVILPKYDAIGADFKQQMTLKAELSVPLSWRQQYCGVEELVYQGVTFYFIDNEYYFKRPGLYGHYDDAERYAYFARAVLECLPALDFKPDIIHCHDWHTGMINAFLKAHYAHDPFYQEMKTLFTIHNLGYQGVFAKEITQDILGLDESYLSPDKLEFNDGVNFMKGGLVFADQISTVSRTYAEEIQYPYFGEKLDGLLRQRRDDLTGIVNGLDYDLYNPATDARLFANYGVKTIDKKQENKTKLQEKLGLPVRRDIPLIAIVSRLVPSKGLDLIAHILDELLGHESVQLVVLGTGDDKYQQLFEQAAWQYPGKVSSNVCFDENFAHQIYAGADLFLMPSLYEPCGIGQLIALRYGTLPVVRETGGLKDTVLSYNKYTDKGNGFTFAHYNAHDMLYTIKRALGLYYDIPVWNRIVTNAMSSDYSWQESAKQYVGLYHKLVSR
ncbi:MAG: glycogen synthase GlgA [Negativicutes bacterium]|nr:glycogen synthase GlgA [Negativicutes bacterium]